MWISECRVKRSLAAITILFSVVRLLMSIARHPGLERFGLYYMMLYRVTLSFLKFLFWYSSFVLAFGLSFYIIFHDDTKYSTQKNITTGDARNVETPQLIGSYTIRKINDSHDDQNFNIEFSEPVKKEGVEKLMFPPRGLHLNGSSLIINAERIAVRFHTLFTPFSQLITVNLHTPVAEKKY